MKNLTRAQRKKAMRSFEVGDVVTWGCGFSAHRVIEVTKRGLVVDVSFLKDEFWARSSVLVLYDSNVQGLGPRCRFREHGVIAGPPVRYDGEPGPLKPSSTSR